MFNEGERWQAASRLVYKYIPCTYIQYCTCVFMRLRFLGVSGLPSRLVVQLPMTGREVFKEC